MKRKSIIKKDNFQAKLAFYLSLGIIVPLFNVGFSFAAVVIAFKALSQIKSDHRFGGLKYAVAALVIGCAGVVSSIIGIVIFLLKRFTCDNLPPIF